MKRAAAVRPLRGWLEQHEGSSPLLLQPPNISIAMEIEILKKEEKNSNSQNIIYSGGPPRKIFHVTLGRFFFLLFSRGDIHEGRGSCRVSYFRSLLYANA